MTRVALTVRVGEHVRDALEHLSAVEGRPVNQLLNDAIEGYLRRPGSQEQSVEGIVAGSRAYREKDPDFKQAFSDLISAEASLNDPVEGKWVESASGPSGPAQSSVREILSGFGLG